MKKTCIECLNQYFMRKDGTSPAFEEGSEVCKRCEKIREENNAPTKETSDTR